MQASPGEASVCQNLTGCCDPCIRNVSFTIMESGRNVLRHFMYLLTFYRDLILNIQNASFPYLLRFKRLFKKSNP